MIVQEKIYLFRSRLSSPEKVKKEKSGREKARKQTGPVSKPAPGQRTFFNCLLPPPAMKLIFHPAQARGVPRGCLFRGRAVPARGFWEPILQWQWKY